MADRQGENSHHGTQNTSFELLERKEHNAVSGLVEMSFTRNSLRPRKLEDLEYHAISNEVDA